MSIARQQFETLRCRGPFAAESTTVARAVHAVKPCAAGPLVLAGCANGCRTADHQVRRSRAPLTGQLLLCPVASDGGASVTRRQRVCRCVGWAGCSSSSLPARSSAGLTNRSARRAKEAKSTSDRVGERRHNYAFEPSVVRGQAAPRARRKCAPAARDPTPRAAAQRGR
jgi:hypothetical protein